MGAFDFLKKNELNRIHTLESDIEGLREQVNSLSKFKDIVDIDNEKKKIQDEISNIKAKSLEEEKIQKDKIIKLKEEIKALDNEINDKKSQVVELDETILLQEFGLYEPIYDFANSDLYKDKLNSIRNHQKQMILEKSAAICNAQWTIDGSASKGRAMTNQNIKQIIRCFNDECDMLVSKVKFNNIETFKDKINKSADQLNRINEANKVILTTDFIKLKIEELQLAYEYEKKKQEEKEEQKRIREQLREEAKLQKEIEEARRDIEKEQTHYFNALKQINKQLDNCDEIEKGVLLEKKEEIESHLSKLETEIKDIDYREANKKAGYVYVISNIGSFGENVYKIGMTRRLDPQERVDELGDASVPFTFDIHAMIFCDDAPKLEAALHKAFGDKKVNMINNRREFFNVKLEEIEEVVKNNYDKTVDFKKIPEAEQYRESLKLMNGSNTDTN